MRRVDVSPWARLLVGATILVLSTTAAMAAAVQTGESALDALEFRHPDLQIRDAYDSIQAIGIEEAALEDLARLSAPAETAHLDSLTGRWATLLPVRPLIPGTGVGNNLTWDGLRVGAPESLGALESVAGEAFSSYVRDHAAELRVLPTEMAALSVSANASGNHIALVAPREVFGVPVRDSNITGIINHGNLVLLGAYRWGDINVSTVPNVSEVVAREALNDHLGRRFPDGAWRETTLELIPVAGDDRLAGQGIAYRLAWVLSPAFDDQLGRWEALVDAHDGEFLAFTDTNHYATRKVAGGIYPVSNDGQAPDGVEQASYPMPFADVTTPTGTVTTDSAGHLPNDVSGNITTSLVGDFVRISDNCGSISETSGSGDLDLGTSGGDDCTTPPGGSNGNTHSSRTNFYEVNRIKEQARAYLPSNGWLTNQLTANVNIVASCNAFWSGSINMFRSGGGCGNTGEIAGVVDHEWGHGMDDNNANGSISNPGEGTADIYAALRLNDSCIGRGFFDFGDCSGYGDPCVDCSGIRDIDYAERNSGNPHDVAWIDANCGGGPAPCGGIVHCEGAVYSESVWDIHARDLQSAPFNYDANRALEIATRLHYLGANAVSSWYTCNNGNGGCGANGGYLQFLAADDDNGNVNDGTPHMEAIKNAFDRHGIDCNTPAVSNSGCSGAPTSAPVVTGTAGDRSASLSWAAVPGATEYNIYRTEGVFGCDFGKEWIGTTTSTSFTDTAVTNDFDYYYTVAAIGPSDTCIGPMSSCTTVRPTDGGGGGGFCFDFDAFCDGLELSASGGVVTGDWVNYDCAGSRAPLSGDITNGTARVLCDGMNGVCNVTPGTDWGFQIDTPLDGTMRMWQNDGSGWNIWIDPLDYTQSGAPCTFAQGGGAPSTSAQ